jgi:hypothetical protein
LGISITRFAPARQAYRVSDKDSRIEQTRVLLWLTFFSFPLPFIATFQQVPTQGVDTLRALPHQKIPRVKFSEDAKAEAFQREFGR